LKKISIISDVKDGNLKRNRSLIKRAIASFENKTIKITIERSRRKRSNQQNAYYWGVCLPIVQNGLYDATGETRDLNSIHYQILLPLLAPKREIVNKESGEVINEKMTSSEMTTTDFMEYINEVQKWSAEFLNVDIPDPNEELTLNFK